MDPIAFAVVGVLAVVGILIGIAFVSMIRNTRRGVSGLAVPCPVRFSWWLAMC